MPRKTAKPKETPAEQHKRFVETAKKLGTDESPEAFDRAFKKTVKPAKKGIKTS
jgi:hypothetical protein